jgi:adenosine kinase
MVAHTAECREAGIPFAADPSQQLARILDGDQVRALVDGADYLFGNEYEEALIERKSGWGGQEMLARVGVRITTLGPAGARIEREGRPPVTVPAVPDAKPVDPTGSGDAFRSGFLAAVAWGLSLERAAQLGNLLAVHALEATGPQEYNLKPGPLADRFAAAYGDTAAAEVAAHLPA